MKTEELPSTNISRPIRYWAGGHSWDEVSQLERFKGEGIWQNGFKRDGDKGRRSWELFDQIQVGDEFAIKGANYGKVKIYSLGRVKSINADEGILHLEEIERGPLYNGRANWGADAGSWNTTLLEVTRPDIINLIFHHNERKPPSMKIHPLNQILYGPPGTGKTFNTIRLAVEIIEGAEYSDDASGHNEAKKKFDELRAQGRIEFVTFHQSFGYEDFVEGIRPVMKGSAKAGARYKVRDGILKEIADRALKNNQSESKNPATPPTDFETLWNKFVEKFSDPNAVLTTIYKYETFRLRIESSIVVGRKIESESQYQYQVSKQHIQQIYSRIHNKSRPTDSELRSAAGAELRNEAEKNSHLTGSIIRELNRIHQEILQLPLWSDDSPNLENQSDQIKRTKTSNYVLIIDEINRGNISKILGELITLIEEDKRIGNDNALELTLPVSGKPFGLPKNLYIIGTMNTADKSLALLDIALRRRFKFKEMPPKFSRCENLSGGTKHILDMLNARITLRKDRDHRIGHSFFIDADDAQFDGIFKSEIIPLLQEYFFNDWDGLRFVLNENGDNGNFIRALAGHEEYGVRNHWQWFFDDGNSSLNCLEQLRVNYQISP